MLTIAIALAAAAASQPTASTPAPADIPSWVAETNRLLERHLVHPLFGDTGVATVTFRRGPDGRPTDITAKSGRPSVSRAAIRTVRAVGVLPPMPAAMPEGQRVTFQFLVGQVGHEDEYDTARRTLLASADRANVELAAKLDGSTRLAGEPAAGVQVAALERR